jgi:hypothetical protein
VAKIRAFAQELKHRAATGPPAKIILTNQAVRR